MIHDSFNDWQRMMLRGDAFWGIIPLEDSIRLDAPIARRDVYTRLERLQVMLERTCNRMATLPYTGLESIDALIAMGQRTDRIRFAIANERLAECVAYADRHYGI